MNNPQPARTAAQRHRRRARRVGQASRPTPIERHPVSGDTELAGLRPANEAEKLPNYVRGIWNRRDYVSFVAINDLRSRQMDTVLGNLWHLLNPAISIGIYYIVFGVILGADRGVDNMLGFLAAGIFTFRFTQGATNAGARSIVGNLTLIRSISFPRALLPITSTATKAAEMLPAIFVLFAVILLTGEPVTLRWLVVPGVYLAQFLFNLGAAFTAARLTTHLRDVEELLPFVFRILLFMSGVIFNVESYIESNGWRWLFTLNPIYDYISIVRWALLGYPVTGWILVSATCWTVGLLTIGFWWFHRAEATYGRD